MTIHPDGGPIGQPHRARPLGDRLELIRLTQPAEPAPPVERPVDLNLGPSTPGQIRVRGDMTEEEVADALAAKQPPAGHDLVVTATPTIMDGYVVRWYRNSDCAQYGLELMSASRNGVRIKGFLHEVPPAAHADAQAVHAKLAAQKFGRHDGDEAAQALATHRVRLLSGGLEPINPPSPKETPHDAADHV